jgi:DNA mismatch repair protein MSH2
MRSHIQLFTDGNQAEAQIPAEVTEEGIKVVEAMLRAWASRIPEYDGEDIVMADDLSPQTQLEELKRCVEEFRPRIEKNQWLQSLLTSL